ncbi:MAG: DUF4174 domain-containing protein [Planctomycetota bacterium]
MVHRVWPSLVCVLVSLGFFGCEQDQVIAMDRSPAAPSYRSEEPGMMELNPEVWAWAARPLLIFSDSSDHPALTKQRELLARHRAELVERDIVVIEIIGQDITLYGEPRQADTAQLKRRHDIPPDARFAVRLVGKDTGIKLRRDTPVTAVELFGLIDSMPMRQQEIRDATR